VPKRRIMDDFKPGDKVFYKLKTSHREKTKYIEAEYISLGDKTYKIRLPNGEIKHALTKNVTKIRGK
jgi:hypothetical protein